VQPRCDPSTIQALARLIQPQLQRIPPGLHTKVHALVSGSVFGSTIVFDTAADADAYKTDVVRLIDLPANRRTSINVPPILTLDGRRFEARKGTHRAIEVFANKPLQELQSRVALVDVLARQQQAALAARATGLHGLLVGGPAFGSLPAGLLALLRRQPTRQAGWLASRLRCGWGELGVQPALVSVLAARGPGSSAAFAGAPAAGDPQRLRGAVRRA
jgi:hypothetical protein